MCTYVRLYSNHWNACKPVQTETVFSLRKRFCALTYCMYIVYTHKPIERRWFRNVLYTTYNCIRAKFSSFYKSHEIFSTLCRLSYYSSVGGFIGKCISIRRAHLYRLKIQLIWFNMPICCLSCLFDFFFLFKWNGFWILNRQKRLFWA